MNREGITVLVVLTVACECNQHGIIRDRVVWKAAAAGLLTLSADSRRVAVVTPDQTGARIYNTADGKEIAAVSFGGRQVSVSGPHSPKQQKATENKSMSAPGSSLFALNGDGSLLAASFEDGSISCFDVAGGKAYDLPGASAGASFEGGFCGNILAWSARLGGKSVCLAADTAAVSSSAIADCFSSGCKCIHPPVIIIEQLYIVGDGPAF